MIKQDMLFVDFPPVAEIKKTVKEENLKRIYRGNIRLSSGNYRTDEEIEKYISESLKRSLP